MRLERLFLFLNLLLILVSIAAHEVAAEEYIFLVGTVIVCAIIWRFHERGRALRINDTVATLICTGAFAFMMLRGLAPSQGSGTSLLDVRVPAIGEFLIIFQCVQLLRQCTARDYFWMYVVSVVHMGTAGLLMPGLTYAFFFVAYALLGVATLAVYHFWHELKDAGASVAETRVSKTTVFGAMPLTLLLMLPLAGIFVLLPRRTTPSIIAPQLVNLGVQPVAGFSEQVRLGQMGDIQDNPQRVMRVVMRDVEGKPLSGDFLLRGTAMDTYRRDSEGRWEWHQTTNAPRSYSDLGMGGGDTTKIYLGSFAGFDAGRYERVQCEVTLEPLDTRLIFTPFAAESVSVPGDRRLAGHRQHHSLLMGGRRTGTLTYTAVSRLHTIESASEAPAERVPVETLAPYLNLYLDLPAEVTPRVRALAGQIAPDAQYPTDLDKARQILAYISDSSRFTYTTQMDPTPGVEPVEDFLFNRQVGHCEYFAASMVVLLRAAGVPARLVTGFKVVEWNPIGEYFIVRQGNAHSWVEAYVRPGGWRTFDPSVMREEPTSRPAAVRRWWRNMYDTLERWWVMHVMNFDAESQSKIYDLFHKAVSAARSLWYYAVVLTGGSNLALSNRQIGHIIDLLERPMTIMAAGVLALIGVYLLGLIAHTLWKMKQARHHTRAARFYGRMERLLARRGLDRRPWQTPWEFREQVRESGWPHMEPIDRVTLAFCLERYAERPPTPTEMEAINSALREIRRIDRLG